VMSVLRTANTGTGCSTVISEPHFSQGIARGSAYCREVILKIYIHCVKIIFSCQSTSAVHRFTFNFFNISVLKNKTK
jgi:hypothetical protein